MAVPFGPIWASGAGAVIEEPPAAVKANGFSCGPANMSHFNWLHNQYQILFNDIITRLEALEASPTGSIGTGTIIPTQTNTSGETSNLGTGTIV